MTHEHHHGPDTPLEVCFVLFGGLVLLLMGIVALPFVIVRWGLNKIADLCGFLQD